MPEHPAATKRVIRVGTRGSQLAVTQAGHVVKQLRALGNLVEVVTISTQGDVRTQTPIARIGGDGVFVRELERALLDGTIDVAVHSLKDLPTAETPGLALASIPRRASPFDALVTREAATLMSLPAGSVVGTASVRRAALIRICRPDLKIIPVRGNVDTRLRRLDAGEYDALVLAAAGLERLGLGDRIGELLEPDQFWPAVAQGALVIQTRSGDEAVSERVQPLDDPQTHLEVLAERACLASLAGGCLAPIGCLGRHRDDGFLELGGCVLEVQADHVGRVTASAVEPSPNLVTAQALGIEVARKLRVQGADAMLALAREERFR
jgi:hydroxymethylbilane synthase